MVGFFFRIHRKKGALPEDYQQQKSGLFTKKLQFILLQGPPCPNLDTLRSRAGKSMRLPIL